MYKSIITNFKTQQSLFLVLFFLSSTLLAQWNTQSPVPTYLDVRGLGAPTAQHVFIATDDDSFDESGSLFESNDGGTTWVQLDIPTSLSNPFYGLFFLDNLKGWAYGNDNYRTTDGGATWTQLPFLGSTYSMKFFNNSFGLATGNFGRFVSYDDGSTWVESPEGIFEFDFTNDLTGLGVSDTAIFRTTNGGLTFTEVLAGESVAAAFLSETTAVSIVDSTFYHSADGGITWTAGANADTRTNLFAVSANIVLAWGQSGFWPDYDDRVFRSSDGGQTWTDLGEVIPAGVFAFTAGAGQSLVAASYNGDMYYSSNAGLTWALSFDSPGLQPGFLSSAAPVLADPQTGYFGYGAGFIIKTTDGGASWFQISSGTGNSLNDIGRFANGDLIIAGEYGSILTSDGDSPWVLREPLSTYPMKAVHVFNSTSAAVVDESGQVFISTNGGDSWSATSGTPSSLPVAEDVHFTTPNEGWVIGQSFSDGALYRTTNGGATWIPVTDFLGYYVAVDAEGNKIWAANVGGVYFRSTDNGASWIEGELPGSPYQISDMDFFNETIGYAVGWYGEAFRSNDGGVTWEVLPTPNTNHNFTDIFLVGQDEIWLSTNENVAYYSATGGQNWAVMDIGSAGFGSFNAIAADQGGNVWVAGYQGYIEHFQGTPPPPLNQPPVASFSFITTGLSVSFTDESYDPDGSVISWDWDFGDGAGSTEQNPVHTYDTANTYFVYLTVTDDDDTTATMLQFITVQPGPGGTFGNFTEVTPLDSIFITPQDEDFWVITTAPADYDSDGDLDIAVLGYYVVYNESVIDKLILMRNDGPGADEGWAFTYFEVPLGELTAGSSDLAWGDLDGDGDLDLVVGTDGHTVVYQNNDGNLSLIDTELPKYWEENSQADFDLRSITWVDYDNDGDPDLFLPSVWDDNNFIYRSALMRNDGANGSGGWLFTEVDSGFPSTSHAQSAWADYDGDQDLDLFLVNIAPLTDDGFIRIYRNDSNGVFTGEEILGSLTVEHGEAQWGDYDGDGDLDILIAGNVKELDGSYTAMALRIYVNVNDSFSPVDVIDCIPCEGWFDITAATWADYDSDGDMDILLAGNYNSGSQIEGRARIYTNDGGVFTESGNELPAPRASGDRGGTFTWLDIDGEGDLDYFIAGQYFVPGGNGLVEAQMHLYRNDTPAQNAAPLAPIPLDVVQVSENTALLTWLEGSDDHTPAAALTYDLELFRNNVPVTMPKRAPEPGNVSAVNEWLLTGLETGTYQWTLRTVDAAYIGSQLAVGEFTIETVAIDEPLVNQSGDYSILQNCPNPCSTSTTIMYSIPEAAEVSLKIYNITGAEVATLVEETRDAGNHEVKWDATNMPAGVYVYRFRSGTFSETKKMIITKSI
jgi:photosystem II stability/assembly factor-like uncharacterized protein